MSLTITSGLSATCLLDSDPANVARARELARRTLREWQLSDVTGLAVIVVSELVTNSIRHGAGPVTVRLSYAAGTLRTEVHDHGTGRPVRRHAGADDEDGRGLALLCDLAALNAGELGVAEDRDGTGKTVFVTLAVAAATALTG